MRGGLAGSHHPGWADDGGLTERAVAPEGGAAGWLRGDGMTIAWWGDASGHVPPAGPAVVLDGSVYNLAELSRTLGEPRAAEPPAALLARAYQRWGEELIPRLRGDFALAIWDRDAHTGLLAVDQVGGRSLFWHPRGDGLLFASELRQLLRALPARPGPDEVSVSHWLALSAPPPGCTMYEGIRRLEPAHALALSARRQDARRYWGPRYVEPVARTFDEAADVVRGALATAVGRRAAPRAQEAVLLSGGLDSTTIAAFLAAEEDDPVHTYSLEFPNHPSVDESALMAGVRAELGLVGVRLAVLDGSPLGGALDYLGTWEVPLMSPNVYFHRPLFERAARDGRPFLVSGQGGDEVFRPSPFLVADRLRQGRLGAAWAAANDLPPPSPTRSAKLRRLRTYGLLGGAPPALHAAVRRLRGAAPYTPEWFTQTTARAYAATRDPWSWKRHDGPRWWAFLVDEIAAGRGPVVSYQHLRRRAQMDGVEVRHPLVDVDVIEAVLGLPPELAFDPRRDRPLLRHSGRGIVPEAVRGRHEKTWFNEVFHDRFVHSDLALTRSLLTDPRAELGAYFDLGAMRSAVLDQPPLEDPRRPHLRMQQLWRYATAECWLRFQSDPALPERLLASGTLRPARFEFSEGS